MAPYGNLSILRDQTDGMSLHGTSDTQREFPQVMTFLQSGMFSCSNILFETLFDRDVQSWTVKITKANIIS